MNRLKRLTTLALLLSILLLSACSTTSDQNITAEQGDTSFNGYYFQSEQTQLYPEQIAQQPLSALGEPNQRSDGNSCEFGGTATLYSYDGFVIETYTPDGQEKILTITLNSSAAVTPEGLSLGMTRQQVIDIYGPDFKEEAVYLAYKKADTALIILIEEDQVLEIQYIDAVKSKMF